jgi:UDP-N-acetylglucosamine--N-acetylmuramyl-(pentapeptide) pyrophosphoryl-undecaprenol N-acetylglucosamine transferase
VHVVIAGGGTGGHLFPGIAVAEELVARGHEVTFVGTARGIEARVCPKEGWPLELIEVGGLKGSGFGGALKGLSRVPRALLQSRKILQKLQPQLVVGVGGYASGPVVLAAALSGRPTAILEQNSVPGFTNKILGKFVDSVFGAFEGARAKFPKQKFKLVGNPIRKRLRESASRAERGEVHGQGDGVLVVGGSQGAHAVNELVLKAMLLLGKNAPRLVHQTGQADLAAMQQKYASLPQVKVVPFIDDMAAAYRGAQLVVCRAGASTLAELTALGVPALLIPFPFAADDHQTKNAREIEAAGGARVLVQSETTPERLAQAMTELLADEKTRSAMAAASRSLGKPNAHAEIPDALVALCATS